MKFWRNAALFCLGGGLYVALELLWRRRSHWSMFLAGGLSFRLLGWLDRHSLPPLLRAGAGAGIITLVELATGLLVNRHYRVWDYRAQPGNFRGQICPLFTLLWAPLSLVGMALHRRLSTLFWVDSPHSFR